MGTEKCAALRRSCDILLLGEDYNSAKVAQGHKPFRYCLGMLRDLKRYFTVGRMHVNLALKSKR
jgi:hypothetical protein